MKTPTEIDGNKVLEAHMHRDFPVALVEITNEDLFEDGKYAVVTNCGWNPMEGSNELDFRFFETLEDALIAFQKETSCATI